MRPLVVRNLRGEGPLATPTQALLDAMLGYGVRSLSRVHADESYVFEHDGARFTVEYVPGESTNHLFGGNSNWRGPIWLPVNYLLIESLYEFRRYYTDDFRVECPTGSPNLLSLRAITGELSRRVSNLFLRNAAGRRSAFGDEHLATAGLGASHQTGWTWLVALLLHPRSHGDADILGPGEAIPDNFGAQLDDAIPASRVRGRS